MATKSHMSRMTIDMPDEDHKRLKALAAVLGKSMREIVIGWIHEHLYSTNTPNSQTLEAIKQNLADLHTQFKTETEALEKTADPQTEALEKASLKPAKANIAIKLVTLAWAPYWRDAHGQVSPAWE